MLAIYGTALLIVFASLVIGLALLRLLGRERPTWLAGAVGFAALTIATPILLRLPGRATTATIILLTLLLASAAYRWLVREGEEGGRPGGGHRLALVVVLVVMGVGSLPFLFNERTGPLGEGIYTNDQAAQLYWTDWLQNGFGPEPKAVTFGYPTGPQSVAAVAAEATGTDLVDAFNGLLLAIAALTALAALSTLDSLPPVRRAVAASLVGMPYLAASFLAQSAFKETAMALLVLAAAIVLDELARGEVPRRASLGALAFLAGAALLTYNVPGLAWLGLAIPIWVGLELLSSRAGGRTWRTSAAWMRGGRDAGMQSVRQGRSPARLAWLLAAAGIVIGVAVLSAGQVSHFFDKLGNVQGSTGRLASPIFPGQALGVWPEGDFQVVRGLVTGAIPAALFGALAAGLGGIAAIRRRDNGLVALLAAAVAIYVAARLFASIYVQAKALAVMSPLVMFAGLRALLAPGRSWRFVLGASFVAAAAVSTLLALRAAPVGFDERGHELETLADRIDHHSVVFLGVDRFAGYWLRGTRVSSPGGYVPQKVRARQEKVWEQGTAMDLDTLEPKRLRHFDYAITTDSAYASIPPPGMRVVGRTASYVLWKRKGAIPKTKVVERRAPGAVLDCSKPGPLSVSEASGTAAVQRTPVVGEPHEWSTPSPFDSPGKATQELDLSPGRWDLSLQYHSQVPVTIDGTVRTVTLPPSLDGMYLDDFKPGHPQDSFWYAGSIVVGSDGPTRITVTASPPSDLQDALGVRRQVWLGQIAATRPVGRPAEIRLAAACGRYIDHYRLTLTP